MSDISELKYLRMSISELIDVVDVFLITEANVTHTGQFRNPIFEPHLRDLLQSNAKVKYLSMDLFNDSVEWGNASANLHFNEQLIRDGFRKYFIISDDDIVVSCDADEVLYKSFVSRYTWLLRRRSERFRFIPEAFVVPLHEMIYKVGFHWVNCGFRGPTIALASYYLRQKKPQWRYGGLRTLRKGGVHFSFVLPPREIVKKILRYSHRFENEKFANEQIITNAIERKIYIFDQERKFKIIERSNLAKHPYPKSLLLHISEFPPELI